MGGVAKFYVEGGYGMHVVTLLSLAALALTVLQVARAGRRSYGPLIVGVLSASVLCAVFFCIAGLMQAAESMAAGGCEGRIILSFKALSVACNSVGYACLWAAVITPLWIVTLLLPLLLCHGSPRRIRDLPAPRRVSEEPAIARGPWNRSLARGPCGGPGGAGGCG